MAARSSQTPNSVDAATNAFRNAVLSDKPMHPTLRSTVSTPAPTRPTMLGGLAARRARGEPPKLSIRDFEGELGLHLPPGGGTSGAGLGQGRPQMDDLPRRSPQATWGTPFENFGKIVYVPQSPPLILSSSMQQGSLRCFEF